MQEIITALALVLILEGLMPFIAPKQYKKVITLISQQADNTLRNLGFVLILIGLLTLSFM